MGRAWPPQDNVLLKQNLAVGGEQTLSKSNCFRRSIFAVAASFACFLASQESNRLFFFFLFLFSPPPLRMRKQLYVFQECLNKKRRRCPVRQLSCRVRRKLSPSPCPCPCPPEVEVDVEVNPNSVLPCPSATLLTTEAEEVVEEKEEEEDLAWSFPLIDLEDLPPVSLDLEDLPSVESVRLTLPEAVMSVAAAVPVVDDVIDASPASPAVDSIYFPTNVEIAAHLEQWGLFDHLLFAIQRQEVHLRTVLNRFASLLEWLIHTHDRFKACTLEDLQEHIKIFIGEEYDLMSSYVQYLAEYKHYQPATVVGHIDDIRICCTWFVLFRTKKVMDSSRMKQHEMLGFITSVKLLRKILNKKVGVTIG